MNDIGHSIRTFPYVRTTISKLSNIAYVIYLIILCEYFYDNLYPITNSQIIDREYFES